MLVILDGLDGTGKTTIANRLRDEHGFTVIHKGPPTSPPVWEYTHDLFDYVPGEGENIVCDRWHLGELVYPHTRNRPTTITDEDVETIETFLINKGALLVYALASMEQICANLLRRGEEYDERQLWMERYMYEKALSQTRLPRVNVCLDRTIYEGYRSLQPILDEAEFLEDVVDI